MPDLQCIPQFPSSPRIHSVDTKCPWACTALAADTDDAQALVEASRYQAGRRMVEDTYRRVECGCVLVAKTGPFLPLTTYLRKLSQEVKL